MSFTKRAYNTAKKLIDKYGDSVTLVDTQTRGSNVFYNGVQVTYEGKNVTDSPKYDPNTGEYEKNEVFYPTKGVVSNFDTSDIVEGVIDIDDIQVLLYAPYVTPEYDFIYNGDRYNVITILQRISVQDSAVIYKVQGRK